MKGGIKVCVEEDGKGAFVRWPGGAGEEWKKTEMLGKRSVVDNVLKQVGLEAFMVLLSFSSCLCGCGSGFGEGETGREEGGGGVGGHSWMELGMAIPPNPVTISSLTPTHHFFPCVWMGPGSLAPLPPLTPANVRGASIWGSIAQRI